MNSSSSNTTLCLFTFHDVLDKSCYLGDSDLQLTLPLLKSVMPRQGKFWQKVSKKNSLSFNQLLTRAKIFPNFFTMLVNHWYKTCWCIFCMSEIFPHISNQHFTCHYSKGTPLQHSCLENPMDGGAWWAALYGVAQSQTQLKRLSSSSSSICKTDNQQGPTV